MPKRLLLVVPSVERGGAEDYSVTLARVAIAAGWEVHAAFSERDELRSLKDDFNTIGVKYHQLEIADVAIPKDDHFRESVGHIWPTSRLLLELRPDAVTLVLCGVDYGLGSQIACALRDVPTALVFQLVPPERVLRDLVRRMRKCLLDEHVYFTVSDNNRYALTESLKSTVTNIHVVPNGIDLKKYSSLDRGASRRALLEDLRLPADSKLILTAGRVSPQKGYDVLLAAARHVVDQHPNARFIWAGDGPDRELFTNLITTNNLEAHVTLLGHRSDVPALLAAADLFVLPTRFEGQPFALLEAMAAQTPIVASRASGITEIIEDRVHGLLCSPEDAAGLGATIVEALGSPTLMIECARQAVARARYFDADVACARVLASFNEKPTETEDEIPENKTFHALLLKQVDAQLVPALLDSSGQNHGSTETPNLVGGLAAIANYLNTDEISPHLPVLHAFAKLKLERSYTDDGAWALAAVLAFRHGVQTFLTMLKDPRNVHHLTASAIEIISQIDSDETRDYLQWVGKVHPDSKLRRYAMETLFRDLTRIERAQEWLRIRANGGRAVPKPQTEPVRE